MIVSLSEFKFSFSYPHLKTDINWNVTSNHPYSNSYNSSEYNHEKIIFTEISQARGVKKCWIYVSISMSEMDSYGVRGSPLMVSVDPGGRTQGCRADVNLEI